MKRLTLVLILFIFATPFLVWHVVISEETIVNLFRGLTKDGLIDVRLEGLKKGMFFSITSEKSYLLYSKANEPILTLEDLRVSINVMSVLTFNPTLQLSASIQGGNLSGSIGLSRHGPLQITVRDAELTALGVLSIFGLSGSGKMRLEAESTQGISNFKFRIDHAKLNPFVQGNLTIPLNLFYTLRGTGSIAGNKIDIKSIAMEGNGINALMKGVLTKDKSDINLELEIMTHSSFEQLPILDGLFGRFKRSSGYYLVPIRVKSQSPLP